MPIKNAPGFLQFTNNCTDPKNGEVNERNFFSRDTLTATAIKKYSFLPCQIARLPMGWYSMSNPPFPISIQVEYAPYLSVIMQCVPIFPNGTEIMQQ